MKRKIFGLIIIAITMLVLSGCFATDTTTIEFTKLPKAIYTFVENPDLNKIDLTEVEISINGGDPITLEQAKALGVVITGDTFSSPGNNTLKIKYQSATITYVYRVEGGEDLAVYPNDDPTNINFMSLVDFRDDVNNGNSYSGKTVSLLRNVDVSDEEWIPIGYGVNDQNAVSTFKGKTFQGTFDGNGFSITIKLLEATRIDNALFGHIQNGKLKNLKLYGNVGGGIVKNSQGNPVNIYFGGFAAWVTGNSTLENLTNYAVIDASKATAGKKAAGIVTDLAYNSIPGNPTVRNCVNYATITGGSGLSGGGQTGGIIATTSESTSYIIENCVNYGNVIAMDKSGSTGGIVGLLNNGKNFSGVTVRLSECINYGKIYGSTNPDQENIGGIVGKVGTGNNTTAVNSTITIHNIYNLGELKNTETKLAGGIFGAGSSSFFNSDVLVEGEGEILALRGQVFIPNTKLERVLPGWTPVDETFIDANDQTYLVTVFRKN